MLFFTFNLFFLLTKTKSFSIENDSVPLPSYHNNIIYNITEIDCFKKSKVLFQGVCHELLLSTACRNDDEWLVLDYHSAIVSNPIISPKCVKRPCLNRKYYWPDDGKCYSNSSEGNLCPEGNKLENNVFGEGVCKCISIPPHEPVNDGICYPLYNRGPCELRSIFVKFETGVQCIFDKCYSHTASSVNKTFVFWERNKKCYALDERGPCEQGQVLKIDPRRKTPVCSFIVLPVHLVDVPQSCSTDHKGNCNDEVSVNEPDEAFITSVLLQANQRRKSKTK